MVEIKNPFEQNEIIFESAGHSYTEIATGKKLVSVSQLLHLYQKKFDETGIILFKCAQREGISKEELKARWDEKRDKSCVYGTAVHAELEHFINTGKIRKSEHADIVKDFKKNVFPIFGNPVFSEVLVYSTDFLISGLSDLVEYNPETHEIIIYDIKTNESLTKKSYNKFLFPLENLADNAINRYSLQLSFYGRLLEMRGFKVKENFKIFWVNPATRKIEIIDIPYLKKEVDLLISHYTRGYEFF